MIKLCEKMVHCATTRPSTDIVMGVDEPSEQLSASFINLLSKRTFILLYFTCEGKVHVCLAVCVPLWFCSVGFCFALCFLFLNNVIPTYFSRQFLHCYLNFSHLVWCPLSGRLHGMCIGTHMDCSDCVALLPNGKSEFSTLVEAWAIWFLSDQDLHYRRPLPML